MGTQKKSPNRQTLASRNVGLWDRRRNELHRRLGQLPAADNGVQGERSHKPKDVVGSIAEKLNQFSLEAFDFFSDGFENASDDLATGAFLGLNDFRDQTEKRLFFEKSEYPMEFVFNVLMRETSLDYLRLQQKADLKLAAEDFDTTNQLAEFLAQRAISDCRQVGLMGYGGTAKLNVVAYPSNRVEIRLLPYSNSMLIAFPITAFTDMFTSQPKSVMAAVEKAQTAGHFDNTFLSTDFLTMSHEVAHMIYRSGRVPYGIQHGDSGMLIQNQMRREVDMRLTHDGIPRVDVRWLFSWLEEIFCDVYGCFIEGPVYVLGFQDVMASSHPSDHHDARSKHPIPALRPLIIRLIMERVTARFMPDRQEAVQLIMSYLDHNWIEHMADSWSKWTDQQWPYGFRTLEESGEINILTGATYQLDGQDVTGLEILDAIEIGVDVMIDLMADWGFNKEEVSQIGWEAQIEEVAASEATKELSKGEAITLALYQKYCENADEQFRNDLKERKIASLSNNEPAEEAEVYPVKMSVKAKLAKDEEITADELIDLVLFAGWSDEGPKGSHLGGG